METLTGQLHLKSYTREINQALTPDNSELCLGNTIESLTEEFRRKRRKVYQHGRRVGVLAFEIGQTLSLGIPDLRALVFGGRDHDLGKAADRLYTGEQKPERMSETELWFYRKGKLDHASYGAIVLADMGFPPGIVTIVRDHHHSFEDRLRYIEGPDLTGIVMAADAFDAATSKRPGDPAMPIPQAVHSIIRSFGNGHLNPAHKDAFLEVIEQRYATS